MEYSLYRLTSDVLESPRMTSPFYISSGVSFLLVLHLWYGGMRVVHQDVRILVHIECCLLWAVNDKLISILAVIGHRVLFMEQAKGQDVCYSLGVIPHRIRIYREITNIFGVCHS